MIPRELVVTVVDDPCILVDGFLFIWKSIINCMQVQNDNGTVECDDKNREDVAMDADDEITMRHMKKRERL